MQEDPNYVIQRYESGKYAIDDSVTKEYLMVCTCPIFAVNGLIIIVCVFYIPVHVRVIINVFPV